MYFIVAAKVGQQRTIIWLPWFLVMVIFISFKQEDTEGMSAFLSSGNQQWRISLSPP